MLTRIRKMAKHEEGFTLIELMVVILIIGILMAIAIPSFIAVRNRGYAASAKANRATAVKTVELLATDNNGDYTLANVPGNLTALETSIQFVGAAGTIEAAYVHDCDGANGGNYIIDVLGRDGMTYTATKTDGGAVVYSQA